MKAIQKFKIDDHAYVKVVGTLVALLLTIIIGVLVFWEVSDAITLESQEAQESKNKTTDTASKKVNRKRRTTSKEKKELAEVTIRDIMQIPKGW